MAINGKTLTAVEALVTATDTSEGDFRTGMDDVLFQVDENEVAAASVTSEKDRLYGLIRDLRAGQWNYITRETNTWTAANKLAIFGSTNAERAGRYRFMVVGGGGGGRNQDSNSHFGGGAGGMVAFDYQWDGVTAPTWTVGSRGLRNVTTAGSASTMTLSNGVVITANAGGQGFTSAGAGGTTTVTGTDTEVTNVLRGIGGKGGRRAGSGTTPGGGGVNVFALGSDDTATQGTGGADTPNDGYGGSVWGPSGVLEDGVSKGDTTPYIIPGGHWMGNMASGNSATLANATFNPFTAFGVGSTGTSIYPGLFGGSAANVQDVSTSALVGGGGGGGSSPGLDGVICWCRMGDS